METSNYSLTKQKSLSQKRCIKLWFKTFTNGKNAVSLIMVQIDIEYQAETKHGRKRMQNKKTHTRKKNTNKLPDIKGLCDSNEKSKPFLTKLSAWFHHEWSSWKSWKDFNKHTFYSLVKEKAFEGPVKMIKSITPYKQCEVWGGYNSIRWNREDTLIKRKKLHVFCTVCVHHCVPIDVYKKSKQQEGTEAHCIQKRQKIETLLVILWNCRPLCVQLNVTFFLFYIILQQ